MKVSTVYTGMCAECEKKRADKLTPNYDDLFAEICYFPASFSQLPHLLRARVPRCYPEVGVFLCGVSIVSPLVFLDFFYFLLSKCVKHKRKLTIHIHTQR